MTDQEIIERMAATIVKIVQEREDCLPHDLLDKGFTIEEINTYWAKAKSLVALKPRHPRR